MMEVVFVLLPFRGSRRPPFAVEERFWRAQWLRRTRTAGWDLRGSLRSGDRGPITFDQPEAPLTAVHLAAYARQAGCRISFLDLWEAGRHEIDRECVRRNLQDVPGRVFLFSCFTNNYAAARDCAHLCREEVPDAVCIIGGPHATGWPSEALDDGFDIVVRGEGEGAMMQLAKGDFSPTTWTSVPGAISRTHKSPTGTSVARATAGLPSPLPAYDLLPSRYRRAYYARLFTAHGCPFHCSFCSDVLWTGMRPRVKSIKRIAAEIDLIRRHIEFQEVYVSDETFTVRHDHALSAARVLHEAGVRWGCETRADLVGHGIASELAQLGCVEIDFGVESLAEPVLRAASKRIFQPQVERALAEASDAGMRTHVNLMVGLPGETERTARDTISTICSWVEQGIVSTVDYFVTVPYPGSAIFDRAESFGIRLRTTDWSRFREDDIPVFDLPTLTAERIYDLWCEGLGRLAESMETSHVV